jgi:protein involved in ribonucleotide reduction
MIEVKNMDNLVPFPQSNKKNTSSLQELNTNHNAFILATKAIEKRMGVPFMDYMGFTGNQQETKEKVARSLRKETFKIASNIINEK